MIFNWFKRTKKENIVPNSQAPYKPIDVIGKNQKNIGAFESYSPTWIYLENYFNERLDTLRRKNDNSKLTIEKTQLIRGEIKAIKGILALAKDKNIN